MKHIYIYIYKHLDFCAFSTPAKEPKKFPKAIKHLLLLPNLILQELTFKQNISRRRCCDFDPLEVVRTSRVFQGSHDGVTWKSLILGNPSTCLVTQFQAKSVLKFFFWVMKQNTQEMVENLRTEIKFGSFFTEFWVHHFGTDCSEE